MVGEDWKEGQDGEEEPTRLRQEALQTKERFKELGEGGLNQEQRRASRSGLWFSPTLLHSQGVAKFQDLQGLPCCKNPMEVPTSSLQGCLPGRSSCCPQAGLWPLPGALLPSPILPGKSSNPHWKEGLQLLSPLQLLSTASALRACEGGVEAQILPFRWKTVNCASNVTQKRTILPVSLSPVSPLPFFPHTPFAPFMPLFCVLMHQVPSKTPPYIQPLPG